jgi:16S rRNA (cytosine1402-N4)-methyltransferase
MTSELLCRLAPCLDGVVVDATVGGGGHAEAVLHAAPGATLLGLDRDPVAVEAATRRLAPFGERARVRLGNFRDLAALVQAEGLAAPGAIIMDIGTSAMQLGDPGRGFSFAAAGPLDMRMGPDAETTAGDLLHGLGAEALANVLYELGEERLSRRIARVLVEARGRGELKTTADLARLVARCVPPPRRGEKTLHPATRTFQALRIAVNDELGALAEALPQAASVLRPGGRFAVITFHSLEDRIVKQFIARETRDCICPTEIVVCRCGHRAALRAVTKKPDIAGEAETVANPRARSAKLRVAEKI